MEEWRDEPTDVGDEVTRVSSTPQAGQRAHLIGLVGAVAGSRYPVDDELVIGRDPSTQIHVSTSDLSRRHARITRTATGDYVLEDLGSRNGTLVNGTPVTLHVLRYGDTIQLGFGTSFVFTHTPLDPDLSSAAHGSTVTQLAAGIAHHFNNLMAVLHSNLSYLARLPGETTLNNEGVHECIQDLRSAVQQASNITRQLLGFARLGKYEDREVDVSLLAEDVVKEVRQKAPKMSVELALQPQLRVRGDDTQLRQALLNLCINAQEATHGTGHLLVKTELWKEDDASGEPQNGPVIAVTVEDSGAGMDDETQRRAFEPFFTTKPPSSGTGLGLPAVYGIIKNHGGDIRMESGIDQGTIFRILLPTLAPFQIASGKPEDVSPQPHSVLLAEANVSHRAEIAEALQKLGYQVLCVATGRDAVVGYLEHRTDIALVVVDALLPGLNGGETARLLHRIQPSLKIIICTEAGTTAPGLPEDCIHALLRKPCNKDALRRAIEAALQGRPIIR